MAFSIYLTLFIIITDIIIFFVLRKKMGFKKAFFITGGFLAVYMVLFFIFVAMIVNAMNSPY
jgi:uncharacterized membrane protein